MLLGTDFQSYRRAERDAVRVRRYRKVGDVEDARPGAAALLLGRLLGLERVPQSSHGDTPRPGAPEASRLELSSYVRRREFCDGVEC